MVIPVYDDNDIPRHGFLPWVTFALVAINVAIVVYLLLIPEEGRIVIGAQFGVIPAFIAGHFNTAELGLWIPSWLTLVTYMFVHSSWVHLAGNMIFLWVFGDDIEAAMGHTRFLIFYLLCGIAAALAHVSVAPTSFVPLIGASGAVAGVIGAYLMLRPFARIVVLILGIVTVRIHAYWLLTAWIIWQYFHAMIVPTDSVVAYWSHLGGLLAGIVLVVPLRRAGVKLFQVRH